MLETQKGVEKNHNNIFLSKLLDLRFYQDELF
jgi:hypothetical protein